MFKRIMKIFGIVLLGFVLVIGCVVAFMAIRGDFKKQVIKPTAITFSIEEAGMIYDVDMETNKAKLLFDVGVDASKVNSFTISAEPANITEKECIIKLSDTSLIKFVTWVDGQWEEYKSNTFYLNRPIYFQIKDVVADNVDDYTDGVLTITVTDKTGLLHTTLDLEIDRTVTSVSFADQSLGGADNNKISNGLFGYEKNYNGVDGLRLEANIKQDYPLQLISAPLKADKPFASKAAKISEIYYIENNQPKMLTHTEGVVKLLTYNDATGKPVYEDCEFLKYDVNNNNYVLNSENSGSYEFTLAMYPTYAVQDEVLNGTFSQVERLGMMITKTVIIDVSGTEASKIRFEGNSTSIDMKLFEDNNFVANNPFAIGATNLGIILSKGDDSPEITGRYGELKFWDDDSYTSGINWTLQNVENINGKDVASTFKLNIFRQNDVYTGEITGNTDISNWIGNPRYDVNLRKNADGSYTLTLECKTQEKGIEISIPLKADSVTGKALSLDINDATKVAGITIAKSTSSDKGVTFTNQDPIYQDWKFESGSIMIVGERFKVNNEDVYHINTLKDGIYLAIVDTDEDKEINNKFITNIQLDHADGNNTSIVIKPIEELDSDHDIKLYAIVINADSTWACTKDTTYKINVSSGTTTIEVNNSSEPLYLPVTVKADGLEYGAGIDIDERVSINGPYAGAGYLMFATKEDFPEEFPFEFIENIKFEYGHKTFYLIGYFNEAGKFVNEIKATGLNYNSRIYLVSPKAKYLNDEGRLQTATEYIDDLMKESYAESGNVRYDKSLIIDRKVYNINTGTYAYVPASNKYDSTITYYDSSYNAVTLEEADINNWATRYTDYYERKEVDLINAQGSAYIESRAYYSADGTPITPRSVVSGKIESDDAYLIVDHYNITSVTYSGANVTINAKASVYGQPFGDDKTFTITIEDTDRINVAKAKDFDETTPYIIANSYYDFDNSSTEPTSEYVGEYFSNEEAKQYGKWSIVADHSSIDLDWNGEKNDRLISEQVASAVLTINHKDASQIIDDMMASTTVQAVEFDSNNNMISATKDAVIVGSPTKIYTLTTGEYVERMSYYTAEYAPVENGDAYDANKIYYKKVGEYYYEVTVADNTAFENLKASLHTATFTIDSSVTVDNYDTKKASLYVEALKVDFQVNSIIYGAYMKLQWTYQVNSEIDFKFYSPELYVQDNKATGYVIDAGMVTGSTYRKAILLKDENAPSDWIEGATFYIRDDKNFASGSVDADKKLVVDGYYYDYEPNKYYRIDADTDITASDIENINYIIEIGYIDGFTHTVFATDASGNLFVSVNGTTTAVTVDAVNAFNIGIIEGGTNSRWIKPVPAYAKNVEFSLGTINNLEFERDNDGVYTIKSAQIISSNQILQLTDNNDKTIKLDIPVLKIVQDGNFKLTGVPANGSKIDVYATTYTINNNSYMYGTDDITDKLEISIGTVRTTGYTKVVEVGSDNIVITDSDPISPKTVKLVKSGTTWEFERSSSESVSFDVIVKSVFGTQTFTLNFESPWKLYYNEENSTNTSRKIYSGTTFVLAEVLTADGETQYEDDPIYRLVESESAFKIGYSYIDKNGDTQSGNLLLGGGLIKFDVPGADKIITPTTCTFTIYYTGSGTDERIDAFELTLCPNVIVTGNTSNLKLDDYNNTSYNLSNLGLKNYVAGEYTYYPEYSNEDGAANAAFADVTATGYDTITYTDADCETRYTTNLASVPTGTTTLTVTSPISEIGTYYVVVSVKYGDILVGDIEFEVTTTSTLKSVDDEGSAQDIQTINLTATKTEDFDLEDNLQNMFNLQRAGDFYYYEVNSYEAGKTYKWSDTDRKYVLLTYEETGVIYYQKATLSDIFWINTTDANLEIIYTYAGYTLTQKGTQLIVSDGSETKTYTFVGTSINVPEANVFDISTGKFKLIANGNQAYVGNVHYITEGGTAIYCTQNAYLFQNTATDSSNEYIALSAEDTGKKIYKFTVNASGNKVEYYNADDISLGNIAGFSLTYDSFGDDLTKNATQVANPEYSIEAIFKIDDTNYVNIRDNAPYYISVAPYIVEPNTKVLLSGYEYTLYDGTIATKGLFDITDPDNKITSISFDKGDYTLGESGNTRSITAFANGNNYTLTLPVTLTYNDGKTYTYNVEFTILNNTQVEISYPFVVDDANAENSAYSLFNSSITNITNGIIVNEDKTYKELTIEEFNALYGDIGESLGYDASVAEWFNNANIKFDVALRGDTIKLTADDLLNINRYQAYSFKNVWQTSETEEYAPNTYYIYNKTDNRFDLVTAASEPAEWTGTSWEYYSKTFDTSSIKSTELVAVSATYANMLDNVVDSVNIYNNNIITISPSLSVSGYLVFKITTTNGSYGYYILKVLVNDRFSSVFNYNATPSTARRTYSNTIDNKITPTGTMTLKDAIGDSGQTIAGLGKFDSSFVNADYSNVYFFMVDNSIIGGGNIEFTVDGEENKTFNRGELIPKSAIIEPNTNVQTLTVAVVIEYNDELIYVGNYQLALSPNVVVTPGTKVTTTNNALYHEYELKTPHTYGYGTNAGKNTITFNSDYFTVEINGNTITDPTVSFDTTRDVGGDFNDDGYTDIEIVSSTECKLAGEIVASINASNQLVIENPTSKDVSFWLELKYTSGLDTLNIYLKFNIAAYQFEGTSDREVGKWETNTFKSDLDLTEIFGDYGGDFTVKYKDAKGTSDFADLTNDIAELDGKELIFIQGTTEKNYVLRITLNDVLTPITTEFNVIVSPSIKLEYKSGDKETNPQITTPNTSSVSVVGSSLYLEVDDTAGVDTINIKTANGGTDILTINVGSFDKVVLSLVTTENEDKSKYILSDREMTDSGNINFAHTAMDQVLQLQITIHSTSGTYATQTLWIKLEQTYTLTAQYRAEGAEMETVASGTGLHTDMLYTLDSDTYTPYTTAEDPQPELYSINAELLKTETHVGDCYSLDTISGEYTKHTGTYEKDKYYKLTATKITATDISAIGISNHLFGGKSSVVVVDNEHKSRFKLMVGETEESSLVSMQAIGLLTPGNPNYLGINNAGDCCSYANGMLTFTYDGTKSPIVTLTISNDTIDELEYKFQVMTAESDFGLVKYNTNLLQIDDDGEGNQDGKMDYISVTLDELCNENFKLATLNYAPGTTPAYINVTSLIKIDGSTKMYTIRINHNGDKSVYNHLNELVTDEEIKQKVLNYMIHFAFDGANVVVGNYTTITNTENYLSTYYQNFVNITLSIVTVDGCERKISVIVSDFKATYGYVDIGENSETIYGGTEGYAITDTISGTTTRITLTNGSEIKPDFTDNTGNIDYYGAVDGHIVGIDTEGNSAHLVLGSTINYKPDNTTGLVYWNSTKNTFGVRSVDDSGKFVTLMFNVKSGDYIIGRVYYCVTIKNNIKIGMNTNMGDVTRYDLYLGTSAYSYTQNTESTWAEDKFYRKQNNGIFELLTEEPTDWSSTDSTNNYKIYYVANDKYEIDLINSRVDGNLHSLFITLEQYSTGNVIYDNGNLVNKALYNGSADSNGKADNINKTYSVYSAENVGNYLRFAVTNLSSGLKEEETGTPLVDVDPTKGILTIQGNPEGTFDLLVYSTNGSGYGVSFTIQVHQFYQVDTLFNNSVDSKGGGGYASDDEVTLYASGTTETSGYAVVAHALQANNVNGKASANTIWSLNADNYRKFYNQVFANNTPIQTMKNTEGGWNEITPTITGSYAKWNLPSVPYANNPGEREYYIVAVRIDMVRNGVTRPYYAFYRVYNSISVSVNPYYIANDRTITYNETDGAWLADNTETEGVDEGKIITIMDTANTGLYSLLTTVTNVEGTWTSMVKNTEKEWYDYVYAEQLESGNFMLLNEQPADWERTYEDYYRHNYNNFFKADFVKITTTNDSGTNPWKEGLYYELNNNGTTGDTTDDYYTLLTSKPTGWDDGLNYFKINSYSSLAGAKSAPTWRDGYYYAYNDIKTLAEASKLGVKLMVEDSTVDGGYRTENLENVLFDDNKITATLPDGLFTNKAKMYVILVDLNTNAELLKQEWTIQANVTIENYDSRPLSTFFLQSEVGQTWYNTEIIGIDSENNYENFVYIKSGSIETKGSDDSLSEKLSCDKGDEVLKVLIPGTTNKYYYLYYVTYTYEPGGDVGSDVFDIVQKYYVLHTDVSGGYALKVNFNAGATIVYNVHDDTIDRANNQVILNIWDYVEAWKFDVVDDADDFDNQSFKSDSVTDKDVEIVSTLPAGTTITVSGDQKIVFNNINKQKDNLGITARIKANGTARDIEIIFNIVINAKEFDGNGNIPYDKEVVDKIPEVLDGETISQDAVNNNSELKKALLGLITYQDSSIDVGETATPNSNSVYNSFSITVTKNGSDYTLVYTYKDAVSTYTRTFTLAGAPAAS